MAQKVGRDKYLARKNALWTERSSFDSHWQEIATYLLPRAARFTQNKNNYGGKVWNNIYDSTGASVSRVNLGQQQAGNVSFMWDGKDASGKTLPPGTYKFEAQATYDGETKGLYTLLPANVDSVTLGQNGGELMLNLAGIGSIGLSQVQVIGQ